MILVVYGYTVLARDWSHTGAIVVRYWYETGTILVCGTGTILVQYWWCTGTPLVQYWYEAGSVLALYWYDTCTTLGRQWYYTGTEVVVYWYYAGTRLGLHANDTGAILVRYWYNSEMWTDLVTPALVLAITGTLYLCLARNSMPEVADRSAGGRGPIPRIDSRPRTSSSSPKSRPPREPDSRPPREPDPWAGHGPPDRRHAEWALELPP